MSTLVAAPPRALSELNSNYLFHRLPSLQSQDKQVNAVGSPRDENSMVTSPRKQQQLQETCKVTMAKSDIEQRGPSFSPISDDAMDVCEKSEQGITEEAQKQAESSTAEAKTDGSPSGPNSSVSSSNGFDMDESVASQQTDATELTPGVRAHTGRHAEMLRLRLRLAQFKIRTNQVDIPFTRLQTSPAPEPVSYRHRSRHSSLNNLRAASASPGLAPAFKPKTHHASRYSFGGGASVVRVVGKSESGKHNSKAAKEADKDTEARQQGYRSPSLPRSQHVPRHSTGMTSPARIVSPSKARLLKTPDVHAHRNQAAREQVLTSSAIKGSAAMSLLTLSTCM